MEPEIHTLVQRTARTVAWLVVTLTIMAMVGSVVWNGVQQNNRAQRAQVLIAHIAHQRDQALQEVNNLVTSNAANTARDAENISLLLNYVSALNSRDAMLFRYLHRLKVPIPEVLLEPVPVPKLVAVAPAVHPSSAGTPKKAKHPKAQAAAVRQHSRHNHQHRHRHHRCSHRC